MKVSKVPPPRWRSGGLSSSWPPEHQNIRGRGIWQGGKRRVVLIRAMQTKDEGEVQLAPGGSLPVAFAVWDGGQGDRDGQKAVSIWERLKLENAR